MVTHRRRQASSPRIAVVWIVVLLVAFAVVVGSTATAHSQVTVPPGGLLDGTYSGGIYLKMGGNFDLGGIFGMTNSIDAAGDATLIIDTDAPSMSGTWTLKGKGTTGGSGTFQGETATFSGSSVVTASGTFSGTPLDGRLKGTSNSEGTWTLSTSKGSSPPFPFGGPGTFDEPLTDLVNECSQLLGKWDSELARKLEVENAAQGANLKVTRLVAYFVLSDEMVITRETAITDRLRDLAKRGNSTLGEVRTGGEAMTAIADGTAILRDVEKLHADIASKESDCPTDKAFQNILTLSAQDGLDAALSYFETDPTIEPDAETLRDMIRLGDGTAATGSGARDTERAADLDGRMEAQANEAFEVISWSWSQGNDAARNEAVSLAALGGQQGWDLENSDGITGSDVLAATGN